MQDIESQPATHIFITIVYYQGQVVKNRTGIESAWIEYLSYLVFPTLQVIEENVQMQDLSCTPNFDKS